MRKRDKVYVFAAYDSVHGVATERWSRKIAIGWPDADDPLGWVHARNKTDANGKASLVFKSKLKK